MPCAFGRGSPCLRRRNVRRRRGIGWHPPRPQRAFLRFCLSHVFTSGHFASEKTGLPRRAQTRAAACGRRVLSPCATVFLAVVVEDVAAGAQEQRTEKAAAAMARAPGASSPSVNQRARRRRRRRLGRSRSRHHEARDGSSPSAPAWASHVFQLGRLQD